MRKSLWWTGFLASGLVLTAAGCKNNPYPDGQYTDQRPPRVEVQKNFVIDAPTTVRVAEGVATEFSVKGTVPSPGNPVFTFDGLPQGAVYSAADQKVTWTPDFNSSRDPNNPRATTRTYEVTITMQSSADAVTVQKQTVVITVTKASRTFTAVGFTGDDYLSEGTAYTKTLTVQNDEFPQGPFTVSESNAPAGVQFSTPDATHPEQILISFTPGYDLVSSYSTKFPWTLYVTDPAGKILPVAFNWQINDVRLDPIYAGPTSLNSNSHDVNMIVIANDPNGETIPTITTQSTSIGTLSLISLTTVSPGKKGVPPSQTYQLVWSNIPDDEAGKTENISLHICVNGRSQYMDQCIDQTIAVTFTFTAAPPVVPAPIVPAPTGGHP